MIEKAPVLTEIAKIWPRRIIRVQMAFKGMTYAALADALKRYGVEDDEHNLRNKVARGSFSATFFLQCLAAMGCQQLDLRAFLEAVEKMEEDDGLDEEEQSRKERIS